MRQIGPAVEPSLDPAQAAVAGGSCNRNIQKAFAHLCTNDSEWPDDGLLPYCTWACDMLFGDASTAVVQVCQDIVSRADPSIQGMPACFAADQAKAFEMLGHDWMRDVFRAWALPGWAVWR